MSRPLHVVIADDEELARRLIIEYLRPHPDITIVAECETGTEAVDAIQQQQPDLIFLDIHMPELTGLEVLEITGRHTGVIFTTAYDQFALRAFDLHAVDYLLKPFSQVRFDLALDKAKRLLATDKQTKTSPTQAPQDNIGVTPNVIQHLVADNSIKNQRLMVRERGQTHSIPMDEIHFIKAEDDYIWIHTASQRWMKTQTLSEVEALLQSAPFVRIHRSYLLHLTAMSHIERPNKDSIVAVLKSGETMPVSRAGYERLKPLLSGGTTQ